MFAGECSQHLNRRAGEVGGYSCGVNHLTTMTASIFLSKIRQGCLSGPEAKWQSMIPAHVSNLVCPLQEGGSVQAAVFLAVCCFQAVFMHMFIASKAVPWSALASQRQGQLQDSTGSCTWPCFIRNADEVHGQGL